MRNADELSIIIISIIIQLTFTGVVDANKNERSQIELGVECGRVPIKYEQGCNSSVKTSAHTGHENPHSHPGKGRILHGQDAKFGEWPWIVHLAHLEYMPSVCSGTLISSQWILSAGHCGVVGTASQWRATFGLYNIDEPDPSAVTALIDKIIVHPRYSKLDNDVALFRLAKPIEYSKYIQPVCLISSTVDLISYARNKTCLALGYGRLVSGEMATKLQELSIVVHEPSKCAPYLGNKGKLKEGAACTGPMGEIGATCRGDSGGPNICYNSQQDRWELFGSVSYGPKLCNRRKGDKWLTAVADLTKYADWIRETVRAGGDTGPDPVDSDLDTGRDNEDND